MVSELQEENTSEREKQIFATASHYHFIHTLAILGLPLCRARFCVCFILM